METRLVTNQVRLASWAQIIKDRNASGLSIRAYCEQNGISRNAYNYWLRKLRNAAIESGSARFVELQPITEISQEPCLSDSQVIIELGGARIHVDSTSSKEALSMAVEVLKHAQ